jgi:hypothetical protein
MKNLFKLFFFVILVNITGNLSAATNGSIPPSGEGNGKNNDTTVGINSNIVIFRMIAAPASNNTNSKGSLKKAGKVARTSNTHSSIDVILFQKKGI